jgi:hypothetical protein
VQRVRNGVAPRLTKKKTPVTFPILLALDEILAAAPDRAPAA